MKGFTRSNTFKMLIIVIFVNVSILILSNTLGNSSVASLFGLILDPMQEVTTSFTDEEETLLAALSRDDLERYYIELYRENSTIRNQLLDYYTAVQENEQYETLLEISNDNPGFSLVNATVVSRDTSDPFKSFTINLGYLDGISVGDPVITENGLVGIIGEVSALSAQVITILSEDINVGVVAMEFMESGVMTGDAELSVNGYVKVDYLETDTNYEKGTVISTSGIGATYPNGIIIGEVISVGSSSVNSTLYAVVKPYVDLDTVSDVFIITDYLDYLDELEDTDEEILDEVEEE